jgi:hypothetical protein
MVLFLLRLTTTPFSQIPTLVTQQQNDELLKPVSIEELKEVVFNLNKKSTPGPDGFTAKFYIKAWDFICFDLQNADLGFFQVWISQEV